MILSIPLQAGTSLSNVRYKFIVGTTEGVEQSAGISQPDSNFAVFLFDVVPPDNTTEVIAYDVTDLTNWQVAQFRTAQIAELTAEAPTSISRIAFTTPNRMPFRQVLDSVIRLRGKNPKKNVSEDLATTLTEHINARVQSICLAWPWPEWDVTEERAYRQVWAADRNFLRVNQFGVPDEVFYIPGGTYWKVNKDAISDPPIGEIPSSTSAFWVALEFVGTYIEYAQTCKRTIGQVLGVYRRDPRVCSCNNGSTLRYYPSERGIEVCGGGATVFILYQMPVPQYSVAPFVAGRTYVRGDVIMDGGTGECFQALDTTQVSPASNLTLWRHVPFLQKWFEFVRWGALADSLSELDPKSTLDPNVRFGAAARAEERAMNGLQQQVDSLAMQGQSFHWRFRRRHSRWCDSQPWSGGTVTTLTDACETNQGWVFHIPPSVVGIVWEYHPEIVSLDGDEPSLISYPTVNVATYSIFRLEIDPGTGLESEEWRLSPGPADPNDPNGQKSPRDYDADINNRHWERVGP